MEALAYGSAIELDRRHLNNLVTYLRLSGWQQQDNPRWYEFLGATDAHGHPLLLVLPRDPKASDLAGYIKKAVNLLSAVNDESTELTVQRILYYYSDVVFVVNPDQDIRESISLKLADAQVTALKRLIIHGARSEREPRPYFHNQPAAKQPIIETFRFGHTVRGSFGLTIEAPIIHGMELFTREQSGQQAPLFSNLADYVTDAIIEVAPIERRIVERLVRGLLFAQEATQENSIEPLTRNYGSGFSGNMCHYVAEMGEDSRPVEYRVLWSPKIPVADDLRHVKQVRLHSTSYVLLKEAGREMKKLEPQIERIRGLVTHIGSVVPPLSDIGPGRQVIIRGERSDTKRLHNVIVPLDKDQYIQAHKAHLDWKAVEVSGVVERVGSTYHLLDAHDFHVDD